MNEIDVRTLHPRERHPHIFQLFDSLKAGDAFDLVNDHAPTPLYYQMLHERPNSFTWEPIEEGPEVWRVRITRTPG